MIKYLLGDAADVILYVVDERVALSLKGVDNGLLVGDVELTLDAGGQFVDVLLRVADQLGQLRRLRSVRLGFLRCCPRARHQCDQHNPLHPDDLFYFNLFH